MRLARVWFKGRESNGIILHGLKDHSAGPEDYDRPEGRVFLGAYYDFIAAFQDHRLNNHLGLRII